MRLFVRSRRLHFGACLPDAPKQAAGIQLNTRTAFRWTANRSEAARGRAARAMRFFHDSGHKSNMEADYGRCRRRL
jgi:hypothetical protein